MTYTEIRPIFKKHYNSIQAFLEKGEKEIEEEGSKGKSESSEQKAAKKQRINEEVAELKKHIQIVLNDEDDVYWPSDTPVCYLRTCEQCGIILNYGTCLNCNSKTGNSFTYDIILESFDEVPNPPPQCHFNIYLYQICESNSHYGYECSQRVPLVYEPEPCYIQNFSDNDSSHNWPGMVLMLVKIAQHKFLLFKLCQVFHSNILIVKIVRLLMNLTSVNQRIMTIITSRILAMILILLYGDEYLDTILATESDEFRKSSVENLVPNPSESEGKNGCDVPACFTTFSNFLFDAEYEFKSVVDQLLFDEDFLEKTFSNPLFEEEIIPIKIDQHHFNAESDLIESMLNHDSSIISSSLKIDSLLDEFADELTLLKSIQPKIDETDHDPEEDIRLIEILLYDNSSPCPPEEFVSKYSNAKIESFSPSPIPVKDIDSFMEEIDLTFTPDDPMPPSIEDDDYDSKRDILILKELLDNYSFSPPENESFYFDIPSLSHHPAKPPYGNIGILNIKTMGDNSEQKVPVVDYQIHQEHNKPFYKIIRADGTHQLFLSFITLLRNFDREDLEMPWKLVQERFQSSEPKNFSNDFLLNTFKIMFKKPNVEDSIWRDQRGRYGLAKVKSWKLFESCGVHVITFTTTQMILLVERKYPLTRFTLEQMLNNVRLEVEEEVKCH
nr:hypothetical protein [Tanacetum cinerariifolium]